MRQDHGLSKGLVPRLCVACGEGRCTWQTLAWAFQGATLPAPSQSGQGVGLVAKLPQLTLIYELNLSHAPR